MLPSLASQNALDIYVFLLPGKIYSFPEASCTTCPNCEVQFVRLMDDGQVAVDSWGVWDEPNLEWTMDQENTADENTRFRMRIQDTNYPDNFKEKIWTLEALYCPMRLPVVEDPMNFLIFSSLLPETKVFVGADNGKCGYQSTLFEGLTD